MIDSLENDYHGKKDMSIEEDTCLLEGNHPKILLICLIWDVTAFEELNGLDPENKNRWFRD